MSEDPADCPLTGDDGAEAPVSKEDKFFGPSWLMIPHGLLRSPSFLLGALGVGLIFLLRVPVVALKVQEALPSGIAPHFGDFYYGALQNDRLVQGFGCLLFLGLMRVIISFATCKYRLSGERLVIAYGLFNKHSPGGWFRLYVDTIPVPMIYDCDTLQGMSEQPWNVGTVILETVDKKSYMIRHVGHINEMSRLILGKAKVSNVRIMGTV